MPDKEHVGYWKMWRQGWLIAFLGSVVLGMPVSLGAGAFDRILATEPTLVTKLLLAVVFAYFVFGFPVFVWTLHKGALTNSSTYRYIPRGHSTMLTRLGHGNPPSTNATEE